MALKRKIIDYITAHYKNTGNALLITGARQTGKTFSIREFGKQFKSFIEINFVEQPDAVELFKGGVQTSEDILLKLSLISKKPLIKGETLVFFDEVQKCPDIVTAIKFLVDEGSYRYILSGSLLGVELKDLRSEPVGYMGIKTISAVDSFVHKKMMELFRLYLVVGGMPAAVNKYIETNNLQEVMQLQHDIIRLYMRDIAQYDTDNKLYINDIFNLIPPELNARNKRFVLKRLNENAKFERFKNSFLWLTNAGVAIPVYNVEEPKMPLLLARSRNLFKLFQNDIGLLAAQYAEGIQLRIIKNAKDINFGAIYENAVAQELVAHDLTPYYYNNKRKGEVDFLIEIGGQVLPIEVKSGKDYEVHRALANIMDCREYGLKEAIVFCNDNLHTAGNIVYAPIYMVMFLQKKQLGNFVYKVDLRGLNM